MANKKKKKKEIEIKTIKLSDDQQKKLFIIAVAVVLVLSLLLIIAKNFGSFENVRMRQNNKTIFSATDLTVNNLKFSDTEKNVKKELGKPNKEEKKQNGVYEYKILYYDGLKLTLKENYNDFMLVGAEITSSKYKVNRNLKVNKSITSAIRKFKVKYSTGTYLYGNYSTDALGSTEITENIYFGVRNKNEVVYVYRDAVIEGMPTNTAKLNISYKHGKITKITWKYDLN